MAKVWSGRRGLSNQRWRAGPEKRGGVCGRGPVRYDRGHMRWFLSGVGRRGWLAAAAVALLLVPTRAALSARPSPFCQGAYASDVVVVNSEARRQEEGTRYSFC